MLSQASVGRYASKVSVFSAAGRYLYSVHAARAKQLVIDCVVSPVEVSKERPRIWKVVLQQSSPGQVIGPPRPLSAQSYKGQSYVFRESVGNYHTCMFKDISSDDLWAFRLAQTDCLSV